MSVWDIVEALGDRFTDIFVSTPVRSWFSVHSVEPEDEILHCLEPRRMVCCDNEIDHTRYVFIEAKEY